MNIEIYLGTLINRLDKALRKWSIIHNDLRNLQTVIKGSIYPRFPKKLLI